MAADWLERSAADLGRAIGAGEIDPRELAEAFLEAAEAHPDGERIYARLTRQRAHDEAAAAAERAKAGRRLGPLDGVPVSWKDLFDTAGTPTEAGSKLLAGRRPDLDAAVVHRGSAEAGLVCLGKTHLSELAFSGLGLNPVTATSPNVHDPERAPGGSSSGAAASVAFGLAAAAVGSDTGGSVRIPAAWNDLVGLKTTHGLIPTTATSPNVHDPERAPGGSSSGAAASVAFGLAAAAVGSDTGGSVRIPAAWNDLVGLKTTHGLIPTEGVVPLARSLDTVGPLCRTVEDAALMLAAMTGEPTAESEDAALSDDRLLVATAAVLENSDPDVLAGFHEALDRLGRRGARLSEGDVPELDDTVRIATEISAVVNTEGWREWGDVIEAHPGRMFPMIEKRFRSGASGSAERDAEAHAAYARIAAALGERIEREGLILLPTVACTAPKVADLLADETYYVERNQLALRNTRLANLLNLTAITVPSGTPMVGLMLFGRPGEEARLLRAARAIEAALAR